MGKPIIWSGTNAKLINSGDLVDKNDFSVTDGPKVNYAWPSHGLTTADIGRPVRVVSGNQLAFAQADTAANAEVVGFIYGIIDTDNVRVSMSGACPAIGANAIAGGATSASTVYFLDDANAGKLTAAEPTNVGSISKPLAVGTSLSSFIFINYRGNTVGSTNARTQISLANNSTTNMQNCASYDAGSIEGWIYIDGTTDYRFYFNAPFSKYGAGGNYYISPSYVGDTPPAGFSITINSSGQSIVTLPNISGFVSATCTYSLNAPAVGTNFPLNLDSANLTNTGITGLTGTAATTAQTSGSNKIGETIQSILATNTSSLTSGAATTILSISVTPGIWLLQGAANFSSPSNNTTLSYLGIQIDTATTFSGTQTTDALSQIPFSNPSLSNGDAALSATRIISVTSTSTYNLLARAGYSGGTLIVRGTSSNYAAILKAVRIA